MLNPATDAPGCVSRGHEGRRAFLGENCPDITCVWRLGLCTEAKLPRLIASTIRAFDVQRLTRSAQYVPAAEYVVDGLLEESDDKKVTDAYAAKGFIHVPASGTPGGVIAETIRRDATLHLAALRMLGAGSDSERTLALRRYVLGLALTAFTHSPSGYLRQGCNLVPDPDQKREFKLVANDGTRRDAGVTRGGDGIRQSNG